jgi:hypothetical protein
MLYKYCAVVVVGSFEHHKKIVEEEVKVAGCNVYIVTLQ